MAVRTTHSALVNSKTQAYHDTPQTRPECSRAMCNHVEQISNSNRRDVMKNSLAMNSHAMLLLLQLKRLWSLDMQSLSNQTPHPSQVSIAQKPRW